VCRSPSSSCRGNHEAQNGDGLFSNYAACLPSRLGINGDYGRGQWWVDSGPVRYIGISPNIALPSGNRQYAAGSSERAWLDSVIQQGKAAGQWVIVGMHIPCLTVGIHGCERDKTLDGDLIAQGVDLVVQGHDHNYSRSHQITQLAKVVDSDNAYARGAAQSSRSSATAATSHARSPAAPPCGLRAPAPTPPAVRPPGGCGSTPPAQP
jgi:3',5'-cyclic AMP phosphodiesterase CpdA